MKTRQEKRKRIPRRRWVKKTKKMFPMNLPEEDPPQENRFSNRPNYPNIIPPLRVGVFGEPCE